MQGSAFDEATMFASIAAANIRALLIGRRALIALGLPLMTRDYDFWIHIDDIERMNSALADLELYPTKPPDVARTLGRYVLEGDEHCDIMVARAVGIHDGPMVRFDDVWTRRQQLQFGSTVLYVPSLPDLILTKRFGSRPRDADDIRMLEQLLEQP